MFPSYRYRVAQVLVICLNTYWLWIKYHTKHQLLIPLEFQVNEMEFLEGEAPMKTKENHELSLGPEPIPEERGLFTRWVTSLIIKN